MCIANILQHAALAVPARKVQLPLSLPKGNGGERLHSRTRDLYHALALPLGKNVDLCGILVDLFEIQQSINRETFVARLRCRSGILVRMDSCALR